MLRESAKIKSTRSRVQTVQCHISSLSGYITVDILHDVLEGVTELELKPKRNGRITSKQCNSEAF